MKSKKIIAICIFSTMSFLACQKNTSQFSALVDQYWEDYLKLYPLEATAMGDNRYNDKLPNSISQKFLQQQDSFFETYSKNIKDIDYQSLNENDQISYDIIQREMKMGKAQRQFPNELLPINQFDCLPLTFAQLGSGLSNQPFKTEKDYHDFLQRINHFSIWIDTAIANMQRGIAQQIVLPKSLAIKMQKQYEELIKDDIKQSIFYTPCTQFPKEFAAITKNELSQKYSTAITKVINPSYKKLINFLQTKYITSCRNTDGYNALPQGKEWYQYWASKWTTTNMSPEEIFEIGKKEVAFLRSEMEKVKTNVQFKGDLMAFFEDCNSNKKFMPFHSAQEVLDSFNRIYETEKQHLGNLFSATPKTKFEIRQTEKFREATASAEYMPASEDGERPGIFYTPIPDPQKFNVIGMQTLFLHEAIPGHHYQVSLQQENKNLPKFRRFIWYGAYGEGWALYTESLGRELGLFADSYQYLGHLSDAMLRAVRLVVDVALHTGKMTHDQAVQYMQANMRTSKEEAVQEIERYMANPGQALSYMIGKKKILALRDATKQRLGAQFDIKKFHQVVLQNGCVPLEILEKEVNKIK